MVAESLLVSIVMPTWNSMRYLDDCVQSLLNQTYSRFELLICDGGSTDGTLEYFASLDDKRFRIVSRKDTGLVNSLNISPFQDPTAVLMVILQAILTQRETKMRLRQFQCPDKNCHQASQQEENDGH